MVSTRSIKKEKIAHLEYCIEKISQKNNGFNEEEVKRLCLLMGDVICNMEKMNESEALSYYWKNIDEDVRKALLRFNIELIV